jgi:putative tryptophan/tyrosine transport system substrate-binding protein
MIAWGVDIRESESQWGLVPSRVSSRPPVRTKPHPVTAFFVVLCCAIARPASAQVVLLVEGGSSIYQQAAKGFQEGFAAADQVEEIYIDGGGRELKANFGSLRRRRPRLVVAIGTQAARAAKENLPDIPILYCLALRPVQNELVGANIGGVTLDVALSQQFESIQKFLPRIHRIGVVYDEQTSGPLVGQAERYLNPGVRLVARSAHTPEEAHRQIEDLLGSALSRGDAFWLIWDAVVTNPANFKFLVELSLKYKVPLIAPARPFVEAGALMSVGADYSKAGQQTGRIAQQVLRREARPEDFEAVPAAHSIVTINGEVARRLGIDFPPHLRSEVLVPP